MRVAQFSVKDKYENIAQLKGLDWCLLPMAET